MNPVILYDHQEEALGKIHNGCILLGGVGTGKSRTGLAYFYTEYGGEINGSEYVPMNSPKDLVIITTAKKRDSDDWEEELNVFGMSTDSNKNMYKNTIVVDSWNNIKKYEHVKDAFFVFDEQRVVGKGAWSTTFLKIVKSNRWIMLTATPGDVWLDYVPVFIANGFFRNRTQFNSEHIRFKPYVRYPAVDRYLNTRKLEQLRDSVLVEMPMERRTIRHHQYEYVGHNKEVYKTVGRDKWNPYTDEPIENSSELFYIWRRVVNSDPDRIDKLIEIFRRHKKIIVFYNFNYELEIFRDLYRKDPKGHTYEFAEWNGQKHEDLPTGDSWVYVVQYTAGAEGWNCTTTDTVVFYSQNYSYRITEQSMGRIDRLNTPYTDLYYYHILSKSPIDMAIRRALKSKKNFNERGYKF